MYFSKGRCLLLLSADVKRGVGIRRAEKLYEYSQLQTWAADYRLKKKQSIIALSGKLNRALFTLGTEQKEYDASDVIGPVRQTQI